MRGFKIRLPNRRIVLHKISDGWHIKLISLFKKDEPPFANVRTEEIVKGDRTIVTTHIGLTDEMMDGILALHKEFDLKPPRK